MESFELIDNLFQIAVLLCACVAAAGILAHAAQEPQPPDAVPSPMPASPWGPIYYVLYLVIIGIWPQVFYVAEISWLAAWLFYLSAQILRGEGMKCSLFAPCRSRRGGHCGGRLSRPRFRPVLSCFGPVFAHGGRDHVSLGISHAKRQLVPKKRLVYDHLRYVAGAVISGFRLTRTTTRAFSSTTL